LHDDDDTMPIRWWPLPRPGKRGGSDHRLYENRRPQQLVVAERR